ncbi:MAG TPA: cytochrome c biogenesis protein DipZ [Bordetella sp.]|nr:cytochrome c biogenesis protein DipZ [Bordetella sp.]
MLLIFLAYLGGALTIVSPCILPVLPFVFSTAGQSFRRSTLPLLGGMILMFALIATLAAVGGGWVVAANQYGRWLALVLVTIFAVALLFPRVAERLTHPLVNAGNRLSQAAGADNGGRPRASFLLGIATGLLWAPCAGPILGLVLTGAALQGASLGTTALLLAYAAGAATSLALALLVGGKVFAAMKRSLGVGEWIRRGLGIAMLAGVGAIALGLDTGLLTQVSTASTDRIEQYLVDRLKPRAGAQVADRAPVGGTMAAANGGALPPGVGAMAMKVSDQSLSLPDEGAAPPLNGAVQWLNSPPLSLQSLRGKVVLVDFWTYSCINCLRTLPYLKTWEEKYRDKGLVVIGVHAPEFAFERDIDNVKKAAKRLGVVYPIAIDNNYAIWKAFNNQYWPAHYFIDAQGHIRFVHFGEGEYAKSEQVIQQLLREAGQQVQAGVTAVHGSGIEQAADMADIGSPETYIGYERAERFVSGRVTPDAPAAYQLTRQLGINEWGLAGKWKVGADEAVLDGDSGRIAYRFKARDLHLVLGPGPDGKPVPFKVTVDGKVPGDAHGADVTADGIGVVEDQRLYQLVREPGDVAEHEFSIEFLAPQVSAYSFTFG